MTHELRVSVIVPAYNSEQYLDEAIESVLSQSFPHWELLIVDDGSTDRTSDIARRHAVRRPGQVVCLEHPGHANRGQSASRNLGMARARGEYLAFLDADDVWMRDKMKWQVDLLELHPAAAMTYGPSQYWHSWSPTEAQRPTDFVQDLQTGAGLIHPPHLLETYLSSPATTPMPTAVMVRRAVAQALGGFDDTCRTPYEDQVFWAKVALEYPIYVDAECLARYRRHAASVMAVAQRGGRRVLRRSRMQFLDWLERYICARGIDSGAVLRTVREQRPPTRHRLLGLGRQRVRRAVAGPNRLLRQTSAAMRGTPSTQA
jgi:glycosyltransferase involved in cell wall biosynthesis